MGCVASHQSLEPVRVPQTLECGVIDPGMPGEAGLECLLEILQCLGVPTAGGAEEREIVGAPVGRQRQLLP